MKSRLSSMTAGADLLDRVLFFAELGGVVDLDRIAAGRALLDQRTEILDAFHRR